MFSGLIGALEKELDIDIDGDGQVGNAPPAKQQAQRPTHVSRVKALFIGINYIGTSAELAGCINDVSTIQSLLQNVGFQIDEQRVLVEDADFPGWTDFPTKQNILHALHWLVRGANPGDTFFLHYSGHGTSVRDESGDEKDGMDEAMVPLDYQTSGMIVDDEIYKIIFNQLPAGCRLTAVMDCCHSGTLLDLPFALQATSANLKAGGTIGKKAERKKRFHYQQEPAPEGCADIIMFSGCKDDQTSADVSNTGSCFNVPDNSPGKAGGACTNALAEALANSYGITFARLLDRMRVLLKHKGFTQIPQLSSSKPVALSAPFSLFGEFS